MRIHPVVLLSFALSLCLGWVLFQRTEISPAPPHEVSTAAKQTGSAELAIEPGPVEVAASPSVYTFKPASPDGIGKFFHGREIAHVMGHPAIGWLERENREDEEAPSKAIAALELAPNAIIADIGAGSGYYSFRIAPKVPLGRVVAVDIQPSSIWPRIRAR